MAKKSTEQPVEEMPQSPASTPPTLPPPPPPLTTQFVSRKDTAQQGPRFKPYPGYLVFRVAEHRIQEMDGDPGWVRLTKDNHGYLLNAADFKTDEQGNYRYRGMYLYAVTQVYWEAMRQDELRKNYEKIANLMPQMQSKVNTDLTQIMPSSRIDMSLREISNPVPVNPAAVQQHMAQMYGMTPQQFVAMQQQIQSVYAQAPANQQGPYGLDSLIPPEEGDGAPPVVLSPEEQAQVYAYLQGVPSQFAGPVIGAGATPPESSGNQSPEGGE
jgi:hypothetical protein